MRRTQYTLFNLFTHELGSRITPGLQAAPVARGRSRRRPPVPNTHIRRAAARTFPGHPVSRPSRRDPVNFEVAGGERDDWRSASISEFSEAHIGDRLR